MSTEYIGRYEIISEIGRGGMAVVYLARDPSVNRQVAVKVLPRQFTFDPLFRERFKREAEVIATLEHPSIVPMYDFGEHEEQPYIVMRHMAGGSLVERLSNGPLEMREIERIVDRVGSALDEAHSRHIVHRDLKPGNVLFDQRGDAYLSDFGIVKMGEAGASLTGSGIIGTPAYMSPEQAQGMKDIDGRADIYALGIILYEMLTGQPPYSADTPMRLVVKHILEPVPALSDLRDDLPYSYQAILERALAKDVDARYQTGKMITRDLRIAASGAEFDDAGTQAMMAAPRVARPAAGSGDINTIPAAQLGAKPPTKEGRPAGQNRTGLWVGIGAVAIAVIASAALLFGGVFAGDGDTTPTAQPLTPTVDELSLFFAQTITAQAAQLNAPSSTPQPTDTPTLTATLTPTATVSGTPPKETATRTATTPTPKATFTPVPTTAVAPTATPDIAGGGCPFACPAGMASYACDSSGVQCAGATGHCETDEECSLFCTQTWPGLQLGWYCKRGVDPQGKPAQGVCICSAKVGG